MRTSSLLPPCLASAIRSPPPCRSRLRARRSFAHSIVQRWSSGIVSLPPSSDEPPNRPLPKFPFRFETGIALFAKRAPRPFPPPFTSIPSASFSDPLSTFDRSRDRRRQWVNGELIRGHTNGDDAVYASDYFLCVNDGVGAWSTRPRGHAGLWSRLILHFWVASMEDDMLRACDLNQEYHPDPIAYLDKAFSQTLEATSAPIDCHGTTTACGAQLFYKTRGEAGHHTPLLYITNLGDSQVLVMRPSERKVLFKTTAQWHWFDCPRQLGTNSPDTPHNNAVVDTLVIQEGDVVLAMSDGVIDNLWEHEIVRIVAESMEKWETTEEPLAQSMDRMQFAASELMNAAKIIALDPFAESPYMEHAIEEGLASAGVIASYRRDKIKKILELELPPHNPKLPNRSYLQLPPRDSAQSLPPPPPELVKSCRLKMRGKRSKQYRKLMEQYQMHFGFREPYQVIVDAELVKDCGKFKMDMVSLLKKTLHGEVKPLITQCSIRHLYANKSEPGMDSIIDNAKLIERRFCGHHPQEHPEPLSTRDCIHSVVDGKNSGRNKHRYVVATQDYDLRRELRGIPGVPLIYINKGVMIMEPMASVSAMEKAKEERIKFKAELKTTGKRKRTDEEEEVKENSEAQTESSKVTTAEQPKKKKKKKNYGKARGPNPLAVKKKKTPGQPQKPKAGTITG
ncbi:hypothetical protein jhhlp_007313 [Lomentospora prolificans]|uniref:U three protein 23 n=1 Tax=Lomentospora prolificans TaxID=41688 RepID=A0A2N3N2A2_9PEZI|nr:hypothetical protein jhhlp_007313 [Lomentospora prolificans]